MCEGSLTYVVFLCLFNEISLIYNHIHEKKKSKIELKLYKEKWIIIRVRAGQGMLQIKYDTRGLYNDLNF